MASNKTYLIEIEIELGEYTLLRKENPWTYDSKIWVFNSRKAAEKEAARWNTARVISRENVGIKYNETV